MAKSAKPDSRIRLRGYKWQKIRESVLSRDAGLCQHCLANGRLTIAKEVDHIIPIHKGGSDSLCNLQALCSYHHQVKTALDVGKKPKKKIGLDGWPID